MKPTGVPKANDTSLYWWQRSIKGNYDWIRPCIVDNWGTTADTSCVTPWAIRFMSRIFNLNELKGDCIIWCGATA